MRHTATMLCSLLEHNTVSRIHLFPIEGRVQIHGRAASLLEVGTGFHPELTGRENIFLNGAILGMTQKEIRKKFDEIIAFAEVEKFLETPVKHYSSGMYVRLAFAVAAHWRSVMPIFKKSASAKLGDVSNHGRAVLLVSHNMEAVLRLRTRVVFLLSGEFRRSAMPRQSYLRISRGNRLSHKWLICRPDCGQHI